MTRRHFSWLVCGMAVLSLTGGAWAQEKPAEAEKPAPPATPATAPTEVKPLQVTVKEVSGVAQCLRAGKDPKWQPLKVGDKLDALTVIRTGFRSRVVLAFADNSEVVVKRATKMGVGQFRKVGKVTQTKVGLKYGAMRVNVSRARGPSDFTVSTPVATLAVRGSINTTGFSDFGMRTNVEQGDWDVQVGPKKRKVGKNETTDSDLTRSVKNTQSGSSVQLGDVYGGLSGSELDSLINNGGGQGIFGGGGAGEGATNIIKPISKFTREDVVVPGLDIDIGM